MSRKVKTKVGFPGNLKDIEVTVEDDEPDPWGADSKMAVLGTHVPRVDGPLKLTGRAKYTFDVAPKGLLYGKILRSPHGAATIKAIDLAAAKKLSGVKAVIAVKKKGDDVVFHGDEVAAVAAESEETAEEALRLIKVDYDDRKCVTTIEAAMKEGAPRVFPRQSNVKGGRSDMEDAEAAFAKADHKVQATYTTEVQTHSCLETHGMVAHYDGDSLTAWVSTQAVGNCANAVAEKAGGRQSRVIAEHVGGGFGSKFGIGPEGLIALQLAGDTGKPVKLMLDRKEEHLNGGNRPSSIQKFSGGVMKDGTIAGIKLEHFGSGGVGSGSGAAQPGFYAYGVLKKSETAVLTNAGGARAFRAPGHPQGYFGMESYLDELAAAIDMDPLEFRKKNCRAPTHLAEMDLAAEKFGWPSRRKAKSGSDAGPRKRGAGMACSTWYATGGGNWKVDLIIDSKANVEVRNGAQDIGTGTRTLLTMIVAEELGISPSQVACRLGDSTFPPGPGSGGSTTAPSLGPAARSAAFKAKRALLGKVTDSLKAKVEELDLRDGKVTKKGQPTAVTFGDLCARIGVTPLHETGHRAKNFQEGFKAPQAGVQMAEVEVDVETGQVKVLKVVAVQDAGRVVDRLTFESQIAGGVIQGVSYALFEDRRLDPHLGVMVNPDFLTYKIAGPKDCPEITAIAFDVSMGFNNAGMMGLGEPPTIPTAAAIANAVANAIGARVRSLPITPDKVLAALEAKK